MLKPVFQSDPLEHRADFQNALVGWFEKNRRDYPWRRTHDPYAVLVSEVMLQQTQIATVLGRGFFLRFLEAFPDVTSLAAADDEKLLKAWEGLGYYRRARMLRETAREVISRHAGKFPEELDALLDLPGVGRYTAGALRAFAFGLPAVVVDGNVARVISRLLDFRGVIDDSSGLKFIWDTAGLLADEDRPRSYHAGLMELGQRICRPGVPDCLACPVGAYCKTRDPQLLPAKKPRVTVTEVDEHALWLMDSAGRVLMHCERGKRRQGLWKLPTRTAEEVSGLSMVSESRYSITRYKVTLRVYTGGTAAEGDTWVAGDELLQLAMPSPFRRVVETLVGEI
ncbi:A/G-specific adenine glycosylase [Luteolibacter pohnpeiensis]|uniref:Adenine DNA glycosylase n=1 Tax=Luteolibacter pohnpeiensis TaxID=454153 RepID=A0A934VWZ1_9BACT|nr:A/G-specific adenine glycosylase [Luteolibacter pohnpeiensis]MBK1883024.1 A/G-specific adenine glycosylase [Luteolibacter pohnpeiensis]